MHYMKFVHAYIYIQIYTHTYIYIYIYIYIYTYNIEWGWGLTSDAILCTSEVIHLFEDNIQRIKAAGLQGRCTDMELMLKQVDLYNKQDRIPFFHHSTSPSQVTRRVLGLSCLWQSDIHCSSKKPWFCYDKCSMCDNANEIALQKHVPQ